MGSRQKLRAFLILLKIRDKTLNDLSGPYLIELISRKGVCKNDISGKTPS